MRHRWCSDGDAAAACSVAINDKHPFNASIDTGEQEDVVRGPLSQQDGNTAPSPQPTPPGMMVGLATQQRKVRRGSC